MTSLGIAVAVMMGASMGQAAGGASRAPGSAPMRIAKVKVTKAGEIHLDKKKVSLKELSAELARVKAAKGAVWYYRERPESKATPEAERTAEAVINKIIELKLPVRLSPEDFQ